MKVQIDVPEGYEVDRSLYSKKIENDGKLVALEIYLMPKNKKLWEVMRDCRNDNEAIEWEEMANVAKEKFITECKKRFEDDAFGAQVMDIIKDVVFHNL